MPHRERDQQRQRLIELSQGIQTRMARTHYAAEWSALELTMPQFRTLGLLSTGAYRMSEIAATMGISMQAATSLIDRLVDKQLVERHHDVSDRRVVLCRLTAAGQAEIDQLYAVGRSRLDDLVNILSDDDLSVVVHAFEIMAATIERTARADAGDSAGRAPQIAEAPTEEHAL